jgi:hypothetical protein
MLSPFGAPRTVTPSPASAQRTPPVAPAPAEAAPAAPAAPRAPAAPTGNGGDAELRSLYERYSESRRRNGENDVSFETVARQVRETMPRLEEKYRDHDVELDVSTKDGKTILRPIVRPRR